MTQLFITRLMKMLNILDKPKPPEDLKVSDVFADNCKLNWEPPKDDGGSPITGSYHCSIN